MNKDTKLKKMTRQEVTKLLYELGKEFHSVNDDGEAITRFECLAKLIWKKALGWTETDRDGNDITYAPDKTFINMVLERIEGRVAQAVLPTGEGQGTTLADKIDAQAKARVNKYAD